MINPRKSTSKVSSVLMILLPLPIPEPGLLLNPACTTVEPGKVISLTAKDALSLEVVLTSAFPKAG